MRRLILPLAALCALALAPAAQATFAGENGRIVYAAAGTDVEQGDRPSSYESLQTIGSDGRRDRFLQGCQRTAGEPTAGDCTVSYDSPAWSPDGRKLVFDAGVSLAEISPRGAGLTLLPPLSSDDGQPAFSPSGRQMALTVKRGSTTDIRVRPGRVVATDATAPDWSARGRIAFVRRGTLYSVRPDGKGLRKLTPGRDPSWSPSGRQVAFARSGGIYVARADGTRARRIVRCSRCATPVFSPDGRQLVYDGGGLRVVRVRDGKRLSTLVEDARGAFDGSAPDWQPR